jgi:hypothetical protein
MAKRTSSRSQADETSHANESGATQARPKPRPSRGGAAAPEDTLGSYPGVERSEEDGATAAGLADQQPSGSASMASEPTDEDIRMRAYQRYLERGGDHGQDFEDWLVAERELKGSKSDA